LCTNDIINNSFELEKERRYDTTHIPKEKRLVVVPPRIDLALRIPKKCTLGRYDGRAGALWQSSLCGVRHTEERI
jgi:hypothetical protein